MIAFVVGKPGTVPKSFEKRQRGNWKSEESRPFRLQHCCDQPEYSEKSWRPKEIYRP